MAIDAFGPGARIGKYEIVRRLAVGGMAEIYVARALGIEGFEKLVVLKRVLPQYLKDEDAVRLLLDEARLAATLDHPNVAQVFDIGETDGEFFFTMEYVRGVDLVDLLRGAAAKNERLSLADALTIIIGAAAGLHHAHEKVDAEGRSLGIVHRDVSPANVLVTHEGIVKVVDFGIAKARTTRRPATRAGEVRGKTAYMSPEQCRAQPLDRRSDVFAIGILLYELTTGTGPFGDGTEYEILHRIVTGDIPPPSDHVPGYPPGLESIVLKALARRCEDRHATALELQLAIEAFAKEQGLELSPRGLAATMERLFGKDHVDQTVIRPARSVRPRRRWAAAMGVLVIVVGAAGLGLRHRLSSGGRCFAGLALGGKHGCLWRDDGTVACWGRGQYGELGNGQSPDTPRLTAAAVRTSATEVLDGVAQVSTGDDYTCARRREGSIWCWGSNALGQLGNGKREGIGVFASTVMEKNKKPTRGATDLFAGLRHACVRRGGGALSCWGDNSRGELGRKGGGAFMGTVPRASDGPQFARVALGLGFTCALMSDGTVRCLSGPNDGSFGAAFENRIINGPDDQPLSGVADIIARRGHVCTLQFDQTVRCWGDGSAGELGSGEFRDAVVAMPVVAAPGGPALTGVRAVRAGWSHGCALKIDGTVWCWGQNDFGQLGTGERGKTSTTPVQVLRGPERQPLTNAVDLMLGNFSSCALTGDGALWCWGQNDFGQLGIGDTVDRAVATHAVAVCP